MQSELDFIVDDAYSSSEIFSFESLEERIAFAIIEAYKTTSRSIPRVNEINSIARIVLILDSYIIYERHTA